MNYASHIRDLLASSVTKQDEVETEVCTYLNSPPFVQFRKNKAR